MAIYRFEAKPVKRSAGRNALAVAAYRAGERLLDERTGQSFEYNRRRGVAHSEVITPDGAPAWARERQSLWQAVERAEKRKDAQLAREIILALPHELSHEERVALVREFAERQFVSKGMVADISLHAPDRKGDQRNHHAHILLTMRELKADGFGRKVRDWNDTGLLQGWREAWADHVNQALERAGHQARVDHRSLAAQGIDREPEPKIGPIATEIERDGRMSRAGDEHRAVKARNDERQRLRRTGEMIDVELERQRRAAWLFDRADYVSMTRDAQRLLRRHERDQEAADRLVHRDQNDDHSRVDDQRRRLQDRYREDDDRHRHDQSYRAVQAEASKKPIAEPRGEMTDARRTAFERLMRNLEAMSQSGETQRPKESGRDDSGGRQRAR